MINWKSLTTKEDISEAIKSSFDENSVTCIFKHSTRCSVSRMVLKQFEAEALPEVNGNFYFLDLLSYREISDAIAREFSIQHQSPQLLILKNGKAIHAESHENISFNNILIHN